MKPMPHCNQGTGRSSTRSTKGLARSQATLQESPGRAIADCFVPRHRGGRPGVDQMASDHTPMPYNSIMDVPNLEEDGRLASEEAVVGYKPQETGKLRIYCFPCAGSGGELFRDFQAREKHLKKVLCVVDSASGALLLCPASQCPILRITLSWLV